MTTHSLEHHGPARPPAAARLGAVAALTPIVMFVSWVAISGWGGTAADLIRALAVIGSIAVVAGWIVGSRSSGSVRHAVVGVVAYPAVAWFVMLPISALSTGAWGVAYGLVSSLYVIPLLTPFGIGWSLTYYALRRATRVSR
jgi:hypothetical protein